METESYIKHKLIIVPQDEDNCIEISMISSSLYTDPSPSTDYVNSIFTYDKIEICGGFVVIYNGFFKVHCYPKLDKYADFAKKAYKQNAVNFIALPASCIKFIKFENKLDWFNVTEDEASRESDNIYNTVRGEWLKKSFLYKMFCNFNEYGSYHNA